MTSPDRTLAPFAATQPVMPRPTAGASDAMKPAARQ
jgi:hypothetical protein